MSKGKEKGKKITPIHEEGKKTPFSVDHCEAAVMIRAQWPALYKSKQLQHTVTKAFE